ncbi:hypothetical protein GCM10011490_08340 [Pseudoclavibacter endophyticus]|uniref:Uncharacterized protein n=1 Tax=Pseudoclavibacter endophyticus TaxID=1778590 RepID=A0A6H9WTG3_9MICO|nr:DUF6264 family protein [Pseudoclavibacter endophyticus]KAB1649694.1 hypothetical protein F8O04_05510 [Pseudoclavibacter endophyticus]GGA60517.1 hypothetical protein GCM10011490_08340 [Pseudoclavibacter endophyticus]
MTSGPAGGGDPGRPPESPPNSDEQQKQLREARRRVDKIYGIGLLVFGMLATIVNMTFFTENALAQQFAALFDEYGIATYARPAGLTTLSLVGIIGHPVIYAITLYITLIVWRRDRIAAWIPVVGAVVAMLFTVALMLIGVALHPELLQAAMTAPSPTP